MECDLRQISAKDNNLWKQNKVYWNLCILKNLKDTGADKHFPVMLKLFFSNARDTEDASLMGCDAVSQGCKSRCFKG
jgi:hypothetical protein